MIVFLTPDGILNRSLLVTKTVPRRVLSLGLFVLPLVPPWRGVFWRATLEHALARYAIALSPFLAALAIWPNLALPIAQAPLLMFLAIWLFERRVLAISDPAKRRALIAEDDAGRALDRLRVAAEAALTRLAAARELSDGVLHLVIEQSAHARVAPLTLVSVIHETDDVRILDLERGECEALRSALFPDEEAERVLHLVNLAEGKQIRQASIEPMAISAHARLAALAAKRAAEA